MNQIVDAVFAHLSVVVVKRETISMKIVDQLMRQVEKMLERGTSSTTFTIAPNATLPTTVVGDFVLSSEKGEEERRTQEN